MSDVAPTLVAPAPAFKLGVPDSRAAELAAADRGKPPPRINEFFGGAPIHCTVCRGQRSRPGFDFRDRTGGVAMSAAATIRLPFALRLLAAASAFAGGPALAAGQCTADTGKPHYPMTQADRDTCAALWNDIKTLNPDPSTKLPLFEKKLDDYFSRFCYRDPAAGWAHDKYVRDTGPYTYTFLNGQWTGKAFGTHAPVLIWYSPEMVAWLKKNRPEEGAAPAHPDAIPDGAVMIKEMYPPPGSTCRGADPLDLVPPADTGAAIMIRDAKTSHDGWFWGWYGWPGSVWKPDWTKPVANSLPNMGLAQYCMNCHASASDNLTFADLRNIAGEPGTPIAFLSQDFYLNNPPAPAAPRAAEEASRDELAVTQPAEDLIALESRRGPDSNVIAQLGFTPGDAAKWGAAADMPSIQFDNTWVSAGGPKPSDTFVTSSQCLGCHDAGSTGIQFDMTVPNPHYDPAKPDEAYLINWSPYATWRTSPMGLAGRDPIFFAQLASETQTFHPGKKGFVEDTCLGCHGILGQRQFHIDNPPKEPPKPGQICMPDFTRDIVNAVPWPPEEVDANHPKLPDYAMLGRDGISCTSCHRMDVSATQSSPVAKEPQNICVAARQDAINPDFTGFAKTFTGSFFVGAPDVINGPFDHPKTAPMQNAFGNKPAQNLEIKSSEMCGTCHSVHLPVYGGSGDGGLGYVFEQATYSEWAFSAYRTGTDAGGGKLPDGAGGTPRSCQDCHMPSTDSDGHPTQSRIASIQEHSRFPEADHALGADDVDVPVRSGFARHVLVGLNVFLTAMAKQFPDVLGIWTTDPMLTKKGVDPIDATERAMLQSASDTATVTVGGIKKSGGVLDATVTIKSEVGHKFPSGVGFRRAFVDFKVLDAKGKTIWESGRTNAAGVIVDAHGNPIVGELWWKKDCSGRAGSGEQPHQPHYQTIDKQNEAQIYQELVTAPPPDAKPGMCGRGKPAVGELTTSFLSICGVVKDNRILPKGFLSEEQREEIGRALGAADGVAMAEDSGPEEVGDDPDYKTGGGDSLVYKVPLADLHGVTPARVEAALYYQATPPFYLQDRLCTAKGMDTQRLGYLVGSLDMAKSLAPDWKFEVAGSAMIAVH